MGGKSLILFFLFFFFLLPEACPFVNLKLKNINFISPPSLLPLHLFFLLFFCSGQSILSSPSSSSSAYLVMRNFHWFRLFLITGVPQRSQWRSSPQTCSRASVVLHVGQKSTGEYSR